MTSRTIRLLVALIAAIALVGSIGASPSPPAPVAQAESGGTLYLPFASQHREPHRYIGMAFDPRSLQTYERDMTRLQSETGVHFAIVHIPAVWTDVDFEDLRRLFDLIVANGSTPFIVWEPWQGLHGGVGPQSCQRDYRLQRILDGDFDPYIGRFARGAAEWGHVFMMDFGHEMNIDQAAWSGWCNGGSRGGPEQFVAAYRYLYTRFAEQGARNVQWVWSPNFQSLPLASWNDVERYYPGDQYVDWIGTNAFNWGASSGYTEHRFRSFEAITGPILDRMAALHPTKPQIVIEAGSVDGDGGSRAAWIAEALASLAARPQAKALIYYNYALPQYLDGQGYDFRVDTDPAARAALREGVRRHEYGQYLYEGRSAQPPHRPRGTGATRGVGLETPHEIYGFEQVSGDTHSLVAVYADWSQSWWRYQYLFQAFPEGYVPLMLWNPYDVPLGEITDGSRDSYLRDWARGLMRWHRPLQIAWAIEPNNGLSGNTWTGVANGGPGGGAALYAAAWRHIVDVFRTEGATNVEWAWIVHYQDTVTGEYYGAYPAWSRPDTGWNRFDQYYPGDPYVDWIGVLAVNEGDNPTTGTYWVPPLTFFDRVLTLSEQAFPDKPQLALLTSVEDPVDPGRKAAWITESYARLKRYRNVRAVVWQHAFNDAWRIDSSPATLDAYRAATGESYFDRELVSEP